MICWLQQADQNRALVHHVQLGFPAVFFSRGTLDFENHLRLPVDIGSRFHQLASYGPVCVIGEAGAQARVALHQHPVTGACKLRDDVGHEGDAPFAAGDLAGNPDQHALAL